MNRTTMSMANQNASRRKEALSTQRSISLIFMMCTILLLMIMKQRKQIMNF